MERSLTRVRHNDALRELSDNQNGAFMNTIGKQTEPAEPKTSKWEPPGFSGVNTAIGAAAALLTAVGVGSGVATRMLRNEWLLLAPVVVVMLGGLIFTFLSTTNKKWAVSVAVFFAGVFGLVWVASRSVRTAERPQIYASFETLPSGLVKVTTTIKADGLQNRELMYVVARGSPRTAIDPSTGLVIGDGAGSTQSVLDQAAFGPNASGSLDATRSFEISPGLFKDVTIRASRELDHVQATTGADCIPMSLSAGRISAQGCARFILPTPMVRPVISASIAPAAEPGRRSLSVNVASSGVARSQIILVKAWVGPGPPLLEQTLAPDGAGVVGVTLSTMIPSNINEACVVASLMSTAGGTVPETTRPYCATPSAIPENVSVANLRNM